jgi:hypothetical protein
MSQNLGGVLKKRKKSSIDWKNKLSKIRTIKKNVVGHANNTLNSEENSFEPQGNSKNNQKGDDRNHESIESKLVKDINFKRRNKKVSLESDTKRSKQASSGSSKHSSNGYANRSDHPVHHSINSKKLLETHSTEVTKKKGVNKLSSKFSSTIVPNRKYLYKKNPLTTNRNNLRKRTHTEKLLASRKLHKDTILAHSDEEDSGKVERGSNENENNLNPTLHSKEDYSRTQQDHQKLKTRGINKDLISVSTSKKVKNKNQHIYVDSKDTKKVQEESNFSSKSQDTNKISVDNTKDDTSSGSITTNEDESHVLIQSEEVLSNSQSQRKRPNNMKKNEVHADIHKEMSDSSNEDRKGSSNSIHREEGISKESEEHESVDIESNDSSSIGTYKTNSLDVQKEKSTLGRSQGDVGTVDEDIMSSSNHKVKKVRSHTLASSKNKESSKAHYVEGAAKGNGDKTSQNSEVPKWATSTELRALGDVANEDILTGTNGIKKVGYHTLVSSKNKESSKKHRALDSNEHNIDRILPHLKKGKGGSTKEQRDLDNFDKETNFLGKDKMSQGESHALARSQHRRSSNSDHAKDSSDNNSDEKQSIVVDLENIISMEVPTENNTSVSTNKLEEKVAADNDNSVSESPEQIEKSTNIIHSNKEASGTLHQKGNLKYNKNVLQMNQKSHGSSTGKKHASNSHSWMEAIDDGKDDHRIKVDTKRLQSNEIDSGKIATILKVLKSKRDNGSIIYFEDSNTIPHPSSEVVKKIDTNRNTRNHEDKEMIVDVQKIESSKSSAGHHSIRDILKDSSSRTHRSGSFNVDNLRQIETPSEETGTTINKKHNDNIPREKSDRPLGDIVVIDASDTTPTVQSNTELHKSKSQNPLFHKSSAIKHKKGMTMEKHILGSKHTSENAHSAKHQDYNGKRLSSKSSSAKMSRSESSHSVHHKQSFMKHDSTMNSKKRMGHYPFSEAVRGL